jgi:predicted dehydrogenase
VRVVAQQTPNGADLHVLLTYPDGSLGTITYVTDGDRRFPKETLDVSGGGSNARLDNFSRATLWSRAGKDVKRSYVGQDKGQRAEVAAFVDAVVGGRPMPIRLESLVATTRATIAVGQSLAANEAVSL